MTGEDQVAAAAPEVVPAIEAPIVAEPVAATEAVVEAPVEPVVEAPRLHTDTESLLETLGEKPAVEPPAEEKPDILGEKPEGDKPEEAAPEGDKPVELEPITYEAFKLPEGIEPDKQKIGEYTEVLGKHRIPQEIGQELLDLHTNSLKEYAELLGNRTLSDQHAAFDAVRADWRKQVMADEQIGGAGWDTAKGVIARTRDLFMSGSKPGTPEYAKDSQAFNDFLRVTGAGDHPAFLKFIHNVGRRFDEPALPPANIKPSPNNGAAPRQRGLRNLYTAPATYNRDTSQ